MQFDKGTDYAKWLGDGCAPLCPDLVKLQNDFPVPRRGCLTNA